MAKILIAGAGYLGLALADCLSRDTAGTHEIVLARRSARPSPGLKTITCDFTDSASLKDLPVVDAIYYAVAADDSTDLAYEKSYLVAVRNLVEHYQKRGINPRFYLSSSTSAYSAKQGEIVTEDSVGLAQSGPSRFIVAGEKFLCASGLEGAVLRYGGLYGPERTSFVRRIQEGQEPLKPNAQQYTNRIHRDDAVGIVAFLMGREDPGMAVINAVDLRPELRDDVIRWVLAELGISVEDCPVDHSTELRRGHKRVVSDKLQKMGYPFLFPSFREGYGPLLSQMRDERPT